jgi:hypothetical protein
MMPLFAAVSPTDTVNLWHVAHVRQAPDGTTHLFFAGDDERPLAVETPYDEFLEYLGGPPEDDDLDEFDLDEPADLDDLTNLEDVLGGGVVEETLQDLCRLMEKSDGGRPSGEEVEAWCRRFRYATGQGITCLPEARQIHAVCDRCGRKVLLKDLTKEDCEASVCAWICGHCHRDQIVKTLSPEEDGNA